MIIDYEPGYNYRIYKNKFLYNQFENGLIEETFKISEDFELKFSNNGNQENEYPLFDKDD